LSRREAARDDIALKSLRRLALFFRFRRPLRGETFRAFGAVPGPPAAQPEQP
jgi:hypothetical protein